MARFVLPILLAAMTALAGCGYQLSGRSWDVGNAIAAADEGDAAAQRVAGDMYYWGEDVPQNWALAQAYWELAAAQGDELAQQRLDHWYNGQPILVVSDGGQGRRMFSSGDSGDDDDMM